VGVPANDASDTVMKLASRGPVPLSLLLVTITDREWIRRFAVELGVTEPTDQEIDDLLDLAGVAARASTRTAAPISCWLVGRAGLESEAARLAAEKLAATLGD